ncbi:MAG: tetratricopeptide repeat protein [Desulfatitalea sp.]|nr:tetratricopeptide repeat protein [Desulfatitalea sp.]
MASDDPKRKGYIKTENVILLFFVALAVGFVGGVAFSAYRSVGTMPMGAAGTGVNPMAAQQRAMIDALVQQTETDPTNVSAWTQLGHLYFDSGEPDKAIAAYERSLALDPDRPDVWTDLGVMYRRGGDARKAVATFDQVLTMDGTHEIALYNKGVVLMHDLNDLSGALAAWEQLLTINPEARTPSGEPLRDIIAQMRQNANQ